MEFSENPGAINWRRITLELLWLMARAALLGVAVAVAVSVPVIIWATTVAP